MATLTELEARLEGLRLARSTGVLTQRLADGRTLTYRSDAELAAAIADLERQIAASTDGARTRRLTLSSSRNLGC